jgi:hypothetical protein
MIHPQTELRYISDAVGYGVFATTDIPKGTIVYVKDSMELCVSPTDYLMHSPEMQAMIDKYSYIDEAGTRIVSWDFAKYVNHSCKCNTMSTGYGFEIAIRDIQAGEEITDEYGIFNLAKPMEICCCETDCRKVLNPGDFDILYPEWDAKILPALQQLFDVSQPLIGLLDMETRHELDQFYLDNNRYRSVYNLRLRTLSFQELKAV